MKKGIIKAAAFIAVFILTLVVVSRIMNKGHDNLTVEMSRAGFPLITMEMDGVAYNQLHGYAQAMDVAFQRDAVTILGADRDTGFTIDTFGEKVTGIFIEVRSIDGSRLIENREITDYTTRKNQISGNFALKDLIDSDEEYSLAVILELEESRQVYYYTRVIWSESLHAAEKLDFCIDFHRRLYDREAARELTKYLETDYKLEDNSSFHKVNIHSSFRQITWGELNVREEAEPVFRLQEIASQTASFTGDYVVSTSSDGDRTYYLVEEYFRIRYSPERMYLLDYERTMTQVTNPEDMYGNDKLLLGIADVDVDMLESEDGNIVLFESANRLFSYDVNNNKLTVIFGFYDSENADRRTIYGQHSIKILDVDEGGNAQFAVYGYMNRGRHEGEVGVQIYTYNSSLNTIEELIYIPSDRTYAVLAAEMEQLLYLNRDGQLYLNLNHTVYNIDIGKRTCTKLIDIVQDESLWVSEDHKIVIWPEGEDRYHSAVLNIRNLNLGTGNAVTVAEGEAIMPLGFMQEDIIYGVARTEDIVEENSGVLFFPMYKICICNSEGVLLKEYSRPGIYVTDCRVEDNQIVLERLEKTEAGDYRQADRDHIMNNVETAAGKNVVVAADIDVYERYVQIQTRNTIDAKSIMILTPKEVVYEGGRTLSLDSERELDRYYVYGAYGIDGIFLSPAGAVNRAYELSGVVVNESGERIWLKGNRVVRNQIMAIKEASVTEEKNSLAVCLDTIFRFEGLVRNSEYLLAQGQTVLEVLEDNLEDAKILDMTGCSLDAMLYYVNRDIPVLALLEDGEAVLITGFNEYNVVIMEPSTGTLYKKGMNDSTEWFAENGNCFITYSRISK
ncbi:MAG: hypothetical protein NC123_01480 [Butyrivibrio sp.]|nr:hypothetical protein [Acetatifactor muris]MCM1558209.1 hypothetical protein [Butyrivibrio sp.]